MDGRKCIRGIGDLWTTHPNLANQLVDKEHGCSTSFGSESKFDWFCPNCGEVIKNRQVCLVVRQGFSCKKCSDGISYPNKFMFSVLSQLNIDFETEKYFNWCEFYFKSKIRRGLYDFYFELKDKKYLIEMDGGLHFINNSMSGLSKQDSAYIDEQKDMLAYKNGFEIIRVLADKSSCGYISKNIINSKLSDIFDLSNVNWSECDKNALNSLVLKVSEMWNDGMSVIEIINSSKISKTTVIRYLNKASKHKFCNYNAKLQMQVNAKNNASKHTKRVICLTTGIIYDSIKSASEFTKASSKHIVNCCKGTRKSSGKLPDGTRLVWSYI